MTATAVNYTQPQTLVHQMVSQQVRADVASLQPVIIGPQFDLKRYASEKKQIGVGQYNGGAEAGYRWPSRPVGGVVDRDWVKVFVEIAETASAGAEGFKTSGEENGQERGARSLTSRPNFTKSVSCWRRSENEDGKKMDFIFPRGCVYQLPLPLCHALSKYGRANRRQKSPKYPQPACPG